MLSYRGRSYPLVKENYRHDADTDPVRACNLVRFQPTWSSYVFGVLGPTRPITHSNVAEAHLAPSNTSRPANAGSPITMSYSSVHAVGLINRVNPVILTLSLRYASNSSYRSKPSLYSESDYTTTTSLPMS